MGAGWQRWWHDPDEGRWRRECAEWYSARYPKLPYVILRRRSFLKNLLKRFRLFQKR